MEKLVEICFEVVIAVGLCFTVFGQTRFLYHAGRGYSGPIALIGR